MRNGDNGKLYSGYKVLFYFMSLGLLFFLILALTIPAQRCDPLYAVPASMDWKDWFCYIKKWSFQDWVAVVSLLAGLLSIMCTLCVLLRFRLKHPLLWFNVPNPACEIIEIKNENYEYLAFMTSYIMPLVCMDFNDPRYVIVFLLLLFAIGFLFIRMDIYYGNPTLAFMGYRLYRASIQGVDAPDGVILISGDKLSKDMQVLWIPIDKHVWIVRRPKS